MDETLMLLFILYNKIPEIPVWFILAKYLGGNLTIKPQAIKDF